MSDDEAQIRKLIPELKSDDINAYHKAVDELVAIGKSVFPSIVQAITDGSLPIAATYEVLREIGVVTPQLVDVLLEYYPTTVYDNERKAIQGILSEAEGDSFERIVFHLQNHERGGVRLAAIETLSEYHKASVLAAARSALSDPNEEVRACAVYILTDRPNRDSVPALIHMLDDEDDLVRADSAGALANIGDPSAILPLINHLNDPSPLMRMDVISALGELGDASIAKYITPFLDDPDEAIRERALSTICRIGDETYLDVIETASRYSESLVRTAAILGLERLHVPSTIKALRERLRDTDWMVKSFAARAVISFKDRESIPDLIQIVQSPDDWAARAQAAIALGELDAVEGIPAIIELLPLTKVDYSSKEKVSDVAVRVLKKLGTPEALQAVEKWQAGQQ